jgi:hypothetical protein
MENWEEESEAPLVKTAEKIIRPPEETPEDVEASEIVAYIPVNTNPGRQT